MRLLLVEDETVLARHLRRGLEEASYAVDVAATVSEATDLAIGCDYDLFVLDVMLPDGSGVELLKRWRDEGITTPALVLTARDTVDDKVEGLDSGADDYLTKPFDFKELLARLRNLLRRRQAEPVDTLTFGEITLDRTRLQVLRQGEVVDLTAKELALLEYLMLHPGRVMRRLDIAEHVWDDRFEARSNVIDVLMGRIRRKLEAGGSPRLIHTVKGLGYVLRAPEEEA